MLNLFAYTCICGDANAVQQTEIKQFQMLGGQSVVVLATLYIGLPLTTMLNSHP